MNALLQNTQEDVMAFLNEIQLNYPDAISLASGRPDESYFEIKDFPEHFNRYVDSVVQSTNTDRDRVLNALGQYNRAKGIVNDLLSAYFLKDEKISVRPENIVVTVGTQEALALTVMTLCDKEKDVIIVEDPSYVGITHFSLICGYQIEAVTMEEDGISIEGIEEKIIALAQVGKRARIVYVIPDFQNPTGAYMSLQKRRKLLELAHDYDFLILEDNAYSDFRYHEEEFIPIKALDVQKRVIYIRSFSKTLYPSLRIAAMIADPTIETPDGKFSVSDLVARTKGYLTVNTPSINQAILGGILIKNNLSLHHANQAKVKSMQEKRDLLLFYMDKFLRDQDGWAGNITWNAPQGGFFMTIHVPFEVDKEEVIACAEQFKVIFTPMAFFYLKEGGNNEIRIAFSNLSIAQLREAIERLTRYFKSKF
jgi:(S)-3,5-dihydroxyphenylglycine transaminase